VPPAAWEGLAVTGKARAAIRRATRAAVRRQYAGLGREIVERLLAKNNATLADTALQTAVPKLGHKNVEDALAAIGRGELAATDMLKAMGYVVKDTAPKKPRRGQTKSKTEEGEGIPVRGAARGTALNISLETGAVPGERIVGILTPGQGITVYPIFAKALEKFDAEPERWIDLAWDATADDQRFPARIKITIHNEVGALAQVAQTIGDSGGNIDELQMVTRAAARDFFDLDILLEVHDLKHLNEIVSGLRAKPLVSSIARVTG
jgi:guanosine-3',5'-bis(diphosphate) 3'-pyrophosphohydrolase